MKKKTIFTLKFVMRMLYVVAVLLALLVLFGSCASLKKHHKAPPEKVFVMIVLQNKGVSTTPYSFDKISEVINETDYSLSQLPKDVELVIETPQGGIYKIDNSTSALDVFLSKWFQSGEPVRVYVIPIKTKQAGD